MGIWCSEVGRGEGAAGPVWANERSGAERVFTVRCAERVFTVR